MEKKFKLIEDVIPEGGVAHTLPGLGVININADLDDRIIERLPEKLLARYFEPIKPINGTAIYQAIHTAEIASVEPLKPIEDGKAKRK